MTREEINNTPELVDFMLDKCILTDSRIKVRKRLEKVCNLAIKALDQQSKTWNLDDAREDFMYDVYNTLDFLPTNDEANRIIDSFNRVTSGLVKQPTVQDKQAESERYQKAFDDGYANGYAQARFDYDQESCDKCVYSTKDGYCQYDDITETIPPLKPCTEQDPCETCGYVEGSPFCLQYCPYDTERKKEQEPYDDVVSREAVYNIVNDIRNCISVEGYWAILERLKKLPSITQKPIECDDVISRQVVLDTISELNAVSFYEAQEDSKECYYEIRQAVEKLPPVTSQPKIGHWIRVTDKTGHLVWECDKCGWQQKFNTNFCSDCGCYNGGNDNGNE